MKFELLLISLICQVKIHGFLLNEVDYMHCYTFNRKVNSTFVKSSQSNILNETLLIKNKCYKYYSDSLPKYILNFIKDVPESISSQCFFYEIYKFVKKLPSIFELNDCMLCFMDVRIINKAIEYDIRISEECGVMSNHLIFVKHQNDAVNVTLNVVLSKDKQLTNIQFEIFSLETNGHFYVNVPLLYVKDIISGQSLIPFMFGSGFLIIVLLICTFCFILKKK